MAMATVKVSGREYVLVPRKEYERLTAAEEDRRDADRARKALARYRAGKVRTISHDEVKRRLGL
jgi:PHD/YefM family antitoxin component YafN of YafNO toxin-antitoxin module